MVCIYCGEKTKVTNSRGNQRIWRRRECVMCGSIFTTHETADLYGSLRVKNSHQSSLQPFSRDILFVSIHESLTHKSTATSDASALCDTIISRLQGEHSNGLLTASLIASITFDVLSKFDSLSGNLYAARHAV
jgi:transcriptional regulator NrdR family protein